MKEYLMLISPLYLVLKSYSHLLKYIISKFCSPIISINIKVVTKTSITTINYILVSSQQNIHFFQGKSEHILLHMCPISTWEPFNFLLGSIPHHLFHIRTSFWHFFSHFQSKVFRRVLVIVYYFSGILELVFHCQLFQITSLILCTSFYLWFKIICWSLSRILSLFSLEANKGQSVPIQWSPISLTQHINPLPQYPTITHSQYLCACFGFSSLE